MKNSSSLWDRKSFLNSIGQQRHIARTSATSALPPIAPELLWRSERRKGPIAFILHRKKQRAFSPISKALVLLLLLGSDRQSRQLLEQRLGLFQIERIEAFGEPAIARSEQIQTFTPLCRGSGARHVR